MVYYPKGTWKIGGGRAVVNTGNTSTGVTTGSSSSVSSGSSSSSTNKTPTSSRDTFSLEKVNPQLVKVQKDIATAKAEQEAAAKQQQIENNRQSIKPIYLDSGSTTTEKASVLDRANAYVSEKVTSKLLNEEGPRAVKERIQSTGFYKGIQQNIKTGGDYYNTYISRNNPNVTKAKSLLKSSGEIYKGTASGIVGQIRDKPVTTGLTYGVGYGVGGITTTAAALVPKVTTPIKVAGSVASGLYFGYKGSKVVKADTYEEKGKVIGETTIEAGAFSIGASSGSKAAAKFIAKPKVLSVDKSTYTRETGIIPGTQYQEGYGSIRSNIKVRVGKNVYNIQAKGKSYGVIQSKTTTEIAGIKYKVTGVKGITSQRIAAVGKITGKNTIEGYSLAKTGNKATLTKFKTQKVGNNEANLPIYKTYALTKPISKTDQSLLRFNKPSSLKQTYTEQKIEIRTPQETTITGYTNVGRSYGKKLLVKGAKAYISDLKNNPPEINIGRTNTQTIKGSKTLTKPLIQQAQITETAKSIAKSSFIKQYSKPLVKPVGITTKEKTTQISQIKTTPVKEIAQEPINSPMIKQSITPILEPKARIIQPQTIKPESLSSQAPITYPVTPQTQRPIQKPAQEIIQKPIQEPAQRVIRSPISVPVVPKIPQLTKVRIPVKIDLNFKLKPLTTAFKPVKKKLKSLFTYNPTFYSIYTGKKGKAPFRITGLENRPIIKTRF